jgi:hypothetical protein
VEAIRARFGKPHLDAREDGPAKLREHRRHDPTFDVLVQTNSHPHRAAGYISVVISLKPNGGIPGDVSAAHGGHQSSHRRRRAHARDRRDDPRAAAGRLPLREMSSTMHMRSLRAALTVAAFMMPILPASTFAAQPSPQAEIFPPWQHGQNNDSMNRGFEFSVPQVDDLADFHGDITDPKLVLHVGGSCTPAAVGWGATDDRQADATYVVSHAHTEGRDHDLGFSF